MKQAERSLLTDRWQRFLARLGAALRGEGLVLLGGLRDPFLGALVLLTLLLVTLACQVLQPFALDIGRRPEESYLEGFHAAEESGGQSYRWSTAQGQLIFAGLGQASYRLDLTLAAPRPNGVAAPSLRLLAGGRPLLETVAQPSMQVYSILLAAANVPDGNLRLVLQSETFTTTQDPRQMGVMLDRVEIAPAGRPVVPALETFLWPALTVLLAVLLARRLGWSRWVALGTGATLALVLAWLLAWARPLLAPGLDFLPLGAVSAYAAVVLLQGTVRTLFACGGASLGPRAERALWTVVAFFLVVRLAGVLHPALETWDLCFQYHRLQSVTQGQLFFTIQSREFGSQETLYLPSLYLLLTPFYALFDGRLVPLKIAEVLLDTSSALLVAYIARRLLGQGRAAALAALLYLTMPLSYIIFVWGIVANVLGQWLFLAAAALLVSPAGRLVWAGGVLAAASLLIPATLAHPGTVQLTALFLGALLVTVWIVPLPQLNRGAATRWALAGLTAGLLAFVIYYSYFIGPMWQGLQNLGAGGDEGQPAQTGMAIRGPVVDPQLGLYRVVVATRAEAVLAGVQEVIAEARAYYHGWPVVLMLAALVGLAWERRALAVRMIALATLIALAFAALGLATSRLYVRYPLFMLPFVAIGSAWWLEKFARQGWAGRAVGFLAGAFLLWAGLAFWAQHVLYYSAGGCR